MRGRHQRQPRLGRALDSGGDVEPFGVAEHRDRHGAGGEQRAAAGDVAGVLHPGGIARIKQQFSGDAQRLLGAGGNHDVGGIGQQSPGGGEMGGDLAAQFRQPLRRRIAGDVGGQRFQHARGTARPGLLGEQVGRRNAACEQRAEAGVAGGGGGGNGGEALAAPGQRTGGGRRRHGRCGGGVRQVGGNVGAAAGAGADIALGGEPLVGQHHGLARHAQFLGQRAGRRQACAGRQGADEDALPQPVEHGLLATLVW